MSENESVKDIKYNSLLTKHRKLEKRVDALENKIKMIVRSLNGQ